MAAQVEPGDTYVELSGREPVQMGSPKPPTFPTSVLPGWTASYVDHLTASLAVPGDLSAIGVLGSLSAALAPAVRVEAFPGWQQPVCLWVVGIADPGTRKTEVAKQSAAPLYELESELMDAAVDTAAASKVEVKKATTVADRALAEFEDALSALAQVDERGREQAEQRVASAEKAAAAAAAELERVESSAAARPRLVMGDATPEAVAMCLAEQGAIALVSDEPTVWANVAGRYSTSSSGSPPVEVFLQAYSGSTVVMDRRGIEGTKRVKEPALTMVVMAQPHALQQLAGNTALQGRGFIDRWIIAQPESVLGKRDHAAALAAARVGAPIKQLYADCFTSMAKAVRDAGKTTLLFDDQAQDEMLQWMIAIEPELGAGGKFQSMPGVVSKRQGDLARIATLLHIAHATDSSGKVSNDWLKPVSARHVRQAIEVIEWALAHSMLVVEEQELDPMTRLVRKTLKWASRNVSPAQPYVTKRTLHQALRTAELRRIDDLDPLLDALEANNWVALERVKGTTGRPSDVIWLHPNIWNP